MNFLLLIHKYNKEKGLLDLGYDDKRESAFLIEEALEGLIPEQDETTPKQFSRMLVNSIALNHPNQLPLSDVDRLDKHIDAIIFSFGSIFKMGLTPKQAIEALTIVAEANMAKSNQTDDNGKNIKGENWIDPKEKLKEFLEDIKSI